jgi:hypothetical protein
MEHLDARLAGSGIETGCFELTKRFKAPTPGIEPGTTSCKDWRLHLEKCAACRTADKKKVQLPEIVGNRTPGPSL